MSFWPRFTGRRLGLLSTCLIHCPSKVVRGRTERAVKTVRFKLFIYKVLPQISTA